MADLQGHAFKILMDWESKHGVAAAVDVTLPRRYYEQLW